MTSWKLLKQLLQTKFPLNVKDIFLDLCSKFTAICTNSNIILYGRKTEESQRDNRNL